MGANHMANEYVVVHVTDVHRFWTGTAWTTDLNQAKTYSYAQAAAVIWKALPAPKAGRLTAVPKSALDDYRGR
jgi:hypothetical protein